MTSSPWACSGDRYWAVPITEPVWVISDGTRLGDPEVRHGRPPLRVDEHVAGLQVAVDDAVRVREPGRGEDLARRPRPRPRRSSPG